MRIIAKIEDIKKKYSDAKFFVNNDGILYFIELNYHDIKLGFNCSKVKISSMGYDPESFQDICSILNLPVPEGINSSDREAAKLIWVSFYFEHEKEIERIKNEYMVLDNVFLDKENINKIFNDN